MTYFLPCVILLLGERLVGLEGGRHQARLLEKGSRRIMILYINIIYDI